MKPPIPLFRCLVGWLLVAALTAACAGGRVEGVNMLYGTDSKVWKTAKETGVFGKKVQQTDEMKQEELRLFANGTYRMSGARGVVPGRYTFDPARKTLTLIPDGADVSSTFAVEVLTDHKLTLKSPAGAALVLEAQ